LVRLSYHGAKNRKKGTGRGLGGNGVARFVLAQHSQTAQRSPCMDFAERTTGRSVARNYQYCVTDFFLYLIVVALNTGSTNRFRVKATLSSHTNLIAATHSLPLRQLDVAFGHSS
jgi:hypothetical protein